MFNSIHHVAIICSDYPKSKHFYQSILGFKIIAENYRAQRDSFKCDMALLDGTQVELFSFPKAPPRSSRPEAQGLRHLAFNVDNIDLAIKYLSEHQIECEPIRIDEFTQQRFTFFKIPTVCHWSFTKNRRRQL